MTTCNALESTDTVVGDTGGRKKNSSYFEVQGLNYQPILRCHGIWSKVQLYTWEVVGEAMLSFLDHTLTYWAKLYKDLHFNSFLFRLLQKESHCLCTDLYKLDLMYFVSFVSLLFSFLFFFLHTGEHTKNGNELHMI